MTIFIFSCIVVTLIFILVIKNNVDKNVSVIDKNLEQEKAKLLEIAKAIATHADNIVDSTVDVVKSENIVGRYKDVDIPAELEFGGVKYLYHGLSDFEAEVSDVVQYDYDAEHYLVLPPGLLYKKSSAALA